MLEIEFVSVLFHAKSLSLFPLKTILNDTGHRLWHNTMHVIMAIISRDWIFSMYLTGTRNINFCTSFLLKFPKSLFVLHV